MYSEVSYIKTHLSHDQLLNLSGLFSQEEGTCLLFSGGDTNTSCSSFLCLFPFHSLWVREKKVFQQDSNGKVSSHSFENPWDGLKKSLTLTETDPFDLPDWIGYFGYEMGAFSDREKVLSYRPPSVPDAYFFRPSTVIKVDHLSGLTSLFIRNEMLPFLKVKQQEVISLLSNPDSVADMSRATEEKEDNLTLAAPFESERQYRKKIEAAKEFIYSGEIYQVNLSQRLLLKGRSDPFRFFRKVCAINPTSFMAYLHFPNFTIVSTSPERFLSKRGMDLETRPIKGTMARGKSPVEDENNKANLLSSPKERAELLMITDLMRHDLGKVSLTGSVKTDQLWHCEAYSNVFHLSSVIRSKAKPFLTPIEIIRDTYPGGSITGCPKLRAMEVIHTLEQRPRGPYTGSLGYFSSNGNFDFNIAIRTLLWMDQTIEIQLGGAIVAESDARKEYEETLHKGESIFKALSLLHLCSSD